MTETFSDHECAVLYLSWKLDRPLICPVCGAEVTSGDEASAGWIRSRRFTCDGCGRTGVHEVPDLPPSVLRETPRSPARR